MVAWLPWGSHIVEVAFTMATAVCSGAPAEESTMVSNTDISR